MKTSKKVILIIGLLSIFLPDAFAHKNHHFGQPKLAPMKAPNDQLSKINELYKEKVKPIFQKKCFDCHSQSTNYPWYYNIPGAKQLIDGDTKEAKEHLDFSNDFPFGGHGVPSEDLDAIQDVAKDNSMPPFRYWILHRDSGLSEEERRIILEWVEKSKSVLKEEK